jgi:hypothetical protein
LFRESVKKRLAGLTTNIVQLENVPPLFATALTICPLLPSNNRRPNLPAVLIGTVADEPGIVLPVNPTLLTWYKEEIFAGGMNRSPEAVTVPFGVFKLMRPEPVAAGAASVIDVAVAVEGVRPGVAFTMRRSFTGTGSKLAPLIVTDAPAATICGAKESIRGMPSDVVTVNESEVMTDPAGDVTVKGPVVAPEGTETTRVVAEAESTDEFVPLKATLSCVVFGLKLEPETVTFVPIGPDFGLNANTTD